MTGRHEPARDDTLPWGEMKLSLHLIPQRAAQEALRTALQTWPRYGAVTVSYESLEISLLHSVIPIASRQRLSNMEKLTMAYIAHAMPPFLPVRLDMVPPPSNLLVGPLVEHVGDEYVIIDGLHRALAARRSALARIIVALIRAETMPAPVGPRRSLADVGLSEEPVPGAPFFENKGLDNYRPSSFFLAEACRLISNQLKGPP
jgi:hypothetical protein